MPFLLDGLIIMNESRDLIKKRAVKLVKGAAVTVLIGILYYLFVRFTALGIPCIFRVITGKYCPGCGISRMFIALFSGDVAAAVRYNLLVMILMVTGAVPTVIHTVRYIKTGSNEMNTAEKVGVTAAFIVTVAFWIMRNTEQFAWLAPI